jgi:hypothetical protein
LKYDKKYFLHVWKNYVNYNIDVIPPVDKPVSGEEGCESCLDCDCETCNECFDDEFIDGYT